MKSTYLTLVHWLHSYRLRFNTGNLSCNQDCRGPLFDQDYYPFCYKVLNINNRIKNNIWTLLSK